MNLPPLYKCSVAVIGLGYVGLPLAISIANQKRCILSNKKIQRKVIGFDLDNTRIMELKRGNIAGKKITPKLLNYLLKKTNGKTLLSNIELVKSNAMLGAKVAKALNIANKI